MYFYSRSPVQAEEKLCEAFLSLAECGVKFDVIQLTLWNVVWLIPSPLSFFCPFDDRQTITLQLKQRACPRERQSY